MLIITEPSLQPLVYKNSQPKRIYQSLMVLRSISWWFLVPDILSGRAWAISASSLEKCLFRSFALDSLWCNLREVAKSAEHSREAVRSGLCVTEVFWLLILLPADQVRLPTSWRLNFRTVSVCLLCMVSRTSNDLLHSCAVSGNVPSFSFYLTFLFLLIWWEFANFVFLKIQLFTDLLYLVSISISLIST